MKNILILITITVLFAFASQANAQFNHPHQHNGIWHQHPHSAAHYHDYWGTTTYYPPNYIYRGQGIWSYTPGAVVTPRRNVIIGINTGYYWSCQPKYRSYWYWR